MSPVTAEHVRAAVNRTHVRWILYGGSLARAAEAAAEEVARERGLSAAELERATMERIGIEKAEARND